MTVYAITDTKNGRTGIAPTYLQTTRIWISVWVRASKHLYSPKSQHTEYTH